MKSPRCNSQLSDQAFQELKAIVADELDSSVTDDEIEAMGMRLLRLFSLLTTKKHNPVTHSGRVDVITR
jgi:hypothetical protein